MNRLRVAVIGVGHLGKEHARILSELPEVELVGVADVNLNQAEAIARRCGTRAYSDYRSLLPEVDAAIVAAPTTYHGAIASEFLSRGIPLLVEKPLAINLEEAEALVEMAKRQGTILQVGHIERYNPAYEELQRCKMRPKFVAGERLGMFTGRSLDVGAVLDLMVHDIDLLLALVHSPLRSVKAVGVSIVGGHEDVANAHLTFENGCMAVLTASRVSSVPVRRMQVWAPEGYANLDFAGRRLTLVQPSAELRRRGLDSRVATPEKLKEEFFGRYLEVLELNCNQGDQLTRELQDFFRCVRTGDRPRASGEEGRDAIALATRILLSIRAHPWEGHGEGPLGPSQLPPPIGPLFHRDEKEAA